MKIQDRQLDEEAPINLMPLIDMVFLLLIFFLVASTIAQEERDLSIQLPSLTRPQALSDAPKQLIVNVDEAERILVAGQVVEADELRAMLAEVKANEPGRDLLIRADVRCKFGGLCRGGGDGSRRGLR